MVFNSLTFVVFFVVVLAGHRLLPSWTSRKALLLVASYFFYSAWNPPFSLLLLLSTVVDWYVARGLAKLEDPRRRRLLMIVSLAANLGLLGYFKYGEFLLANFAALMRACGVHYVPAAPSIILPLGISFYTFETLSYTIDVYRRELRPCRSFLDFTLFVSFFPHLVAGPIVRAADLLPQFEVEKPIRKNALGWGLFLMTLGIFQKNVLADTMFAEAADAVFGAPGATSATDTWLGAIAFAGQIFCDFAGYTTCAIGVAMCFGFSLVDNFRSPYAAVGFRDFWRRWHISLSSWLRDYLYIPLGGNRKGRFRTGVALALTMLLGGLWHGAAFHFVVWGALHGLFLVIERALGARFGRAAWMQAVPVRAGLGVVTFGLGCIAWVFFRATDLPRSMTHVRAMLGTIPAEPILRTPTILKVVVTMTALVGTHIALRERRLEDVVKRVPAALVGLVWAVMLAMIVLSQGGGGAFIYFQF
jgi:D-alanyl-lipoteichoic acid acyltransferase DltB (MBOAT superfamily)